MSEHDVPFFLNYPPDQTGRTDEPDAAPKSSDEVISEDSLENPVADFAPLPDSEENPQTEQQDVDPFQLDSLQAQQAFDAAVAAESSGNKEEAIQHYIRAAKTAESAHEWFLVAVSCRRVGDYLVSPTAPHDLERAFRMYRRAEVSYEKCGLFAEARELAYSLMMSRMLNAAELKLPPVQRFELLLQWTVSGFGYRPFRVIGTALVIVFLYALIYWKIDGVARTGFEGTINFWKYIYFSGTTFTTVGYGDFIPAPHARFLAMSEGFVGAFLTGFFVAVLANRLSKA